MFRNCNLTDFFFPDMPRKRNSAKARAEKIYIHIKAEKVSPQLVSNPKQRKKTSSLQSQQGKAPPSHYSESECIGVEVIIVDA